MAQDSAGAAAGGEDRNQIVEAETSCVSAAEVAERSDLVETGKYGNIKVGELATKLIALQKILGEFEIAIGALIQTIVEPVNDIVDKDAALVNEIIHSQTIRVEDPSMVQDSAGAAAGGEDRNQIVEAETSCVSTAEVAERSDLVETGKYGNIKVGELATKLIALQKILGEFEIAIGALIQTIVEPVNDIVDKDAALVDEIIHSQTIRVEDPSMAQDSAGAAAGGEDRNQIVEAETSCVSAAEVAERSDLVETGKYGNIKVGELATKLIALQKILGEFEIAIGALIQTIVEPVNDIVDKDAALVDEIIHSQTIRVEDPSMAQDSAGAAAGGEDRNQIVEAETSCVSAAEVAERSDLVETGKYGNIKVGELATKLIALQKILGEFEIAIGALIQTIVEPVNDIVDKDAALVDEIIHSQTIRVEVHIFMAEISCVSEAEVAEGSDLVENIEPLKQENGEPEALVLKTELEAKVEKALEALNILNIKVDELATKLTALQNTLGEFEIAIKDAALVDEGSNNRTIILQWVMGAGATVAFVGSIVGLQYARTK